MVSRMMIPVLAGITASGLAAPAVAGRYQPPTSPMPIETTSGVPTSIYDGDTFRFGRLRVRLYGVDAPELETRFGPPARAELVALIADRPIRCRDTGGRSYDRIVARCWNWRGVDLSAAMARTGWAVDWPTYSHGLYQASQIAAQRDHAGVFRYGVQPWR